MITHASGSIRARAGLHFAAIAAALALAACGGGGGSGTTTIELEEIAGKVIDGYVADATVCLDANGNGRCDSGEVQTRTSATGVYQLSIPKDSPAPLVAEVVAGRSRDTDTPAAPIDTSYRMASPARSYSTDISPFTTLVHLTGQRDFPLAEGLVRNVLGLPSRYVINVDYVATPDPLTSAVAKSVTVALRATGGTLDLSAPTALEQVVAALPASIKSMPTLRIETKNAAPIESKEVYVDATFQLTNPAVSAEAMPLNGKIRGRGHSTWTQPKKPYKVQFTSDAAYAKVPDFLGMKKNRNWALLADYMDKSLMRNQLAFGLGNSSVFNDGLKWTSSGQHVEVWLNGEYEGVYLLTVDVRIDPARLNIRKMSTDPAKNEIDGGYIVEVDLALDCYNVGALNLQHVTPQGVKICVSKPDEADITLPQLAYIKQTLDDVETSIYGRNAIDRINVASFVDWYLLNELFRNNDAAFASSVYLWKDTEGAALAQDRLLNLGPAWDFDLGAGNMNANDNWKVEGCWVGKSIGGYVPNWLARLWDNPQFVEATIARWKQKRPALATYVNASIDTWAARLAESQQRNFERWPILGVPLPLGGYNVFATWKEEVAFLKQYLNDRMFWLDKAYATPQSFATLCR